MKCNVQVLKVYSFITLLVLLIITLNFFNTFKNIIIINVYKYGLRLLVYLYL